MIVDEIFWTLGWSAWPEARLRLWLPPRCGAASRHPQGRSEA